MIAHWRVQISGGIGGSGFACDFWSFRNAHRFYRKMLRAGAEPTLKELPWSQNPPRWFKEVR